MKKKFAFLLMGPHYSPDQHRSTFETEKQVTEIRTVRDMAEAEQTVLELKAAGFGAIELCGAFKKEGADKLIALTNNEIAIGYIVHNPEQDPLFMAFFGN